MASIEVWLHILSNIISLPTNIVCDLIDNPDKRSNQEFLRELHSICLTSYHGGAAREII